MDSYTSAIAGRFEDSYLNRFLYLGRWLVIPYGFSLASLILAVSLGGVAADFSRQDWRYAKSIEFPAAGTGEGLVELAPDQQVFSGAAPKLADLRIIQDEEQEVPYKLVVKTGQHERIPFSARVRDLGYLPGQSSSFIADLGHKGTLHNEIEVLTDSRNFQREVTVEGSNDADTWAVLQRGTKIFDFTLRERNFTARNTRVQYPESTVRYLRVRVINDGEEPLNITGASVLSVKETPAQETAYAASIASRREDSPRRTSVIVLDLGSRGLPTSGLTIQTPQVNFYRVVSVEGSEDTQLWHPVQNSDVLFSYDTPRFVGKQLIASYPENTYRYFRLTIQNEDNPPLVIEGVKFSGTARRLIFQPQFGASYRLYYGNDDARTPSYELERLLPYLDTEYLPSGTLGPQIANPGFTVPQPPVSERLPWLIPVAVAVAASALAVLLFGVIRQARKVLPPPN